MAGSTSAEVWLDQRRWDALEEALKAQGSDIEQHLQDYLISLYNEMVPQEQWEQVEKRISNEAAETAREAEEHTVYTVFHVREHGQFIKPLPRNGLRIIKSLGKISLHHCFASPQIAAQPYGYIQKFFAITR